MADEVEFWRLIVEDPDVSGYPEGYQMETVDYRNAVNVISCDPTEYITSVNIHRRHLTAEVKRDLVAQLLKENPDRSNRATAALVKVDDKTVGSVRRDLERRAEIPHVSTVVDTKGRRQPTNWGTGPKSTPEKQVAKATCIECEGVIVGK